MLECIHSLVTLHKYALISMKRHLMEGQSDKHAQVFTCLLRNKREKMSYKFLSYTQSITQRIMSMFIHFLFCLHQAGEQRG